jgi:hypothetical protein
MAIGVGSPISSGCVGVPGTGEPKGNAPAFEGRPFAIVAGLCSLGMGAAAAGTVAAFGSASSSETLAE